MIRYDVSFNTQPPEGGCVPTKGKTKAYILFQHTAARRRLHRKFPLCENLFCCFNTQPPEGGCKPLSNLFNAQPCFNTQPPEGGCIKSARSARFHSLFQHTAARRRLPKSLANALLMQRFQHTAARRRLHMDDMGCVWIGGFNTQPPEGGCILKSINKLRWLYVSTHSRPKAAAIA